MQTPADTQLAQLAGVLAAPSTVEFVATPGARVAAVAALLRQDAAGRLELLLIRRAERVDDVWSGHLALPGGRREPEDADLVATAARETHEEVGVDLAAPASSARLLGALPVLEPMHPGLPPIRVAPFVWAVGAIEPGLSDEVAAVHWVSFDHLRAADNVVDHVVAGPDGAERAFPGITIDEHVLWGMTHRIVHTLIDALDGAAQA